MKAGQKAEADTVKAEVQKINDALLENEALEENISIWESFVLRVPALGLIPFNISIPGGTEVWQILKTIYWADNLLSFSPGDIPYRALSC